jgi:hypothetical protein
MSELLNALVCKTMVDGLDPHIGFQKNEITSLQGIGRINKDG